MLPVGLPQETAESVPLRLAQGPGPESYGEPAGASRQSFNRNAPSCHADTQGSIGDRMKALAKDPKYRFSEGDKGRAEIMAYIQERLKLTRAQLPRAFNTLVPGHLEVKRMPPEEEPGAPGAYGGAGSIDGKIPGKFWINLRDTSLHSKYSLPDLAAHESIPGHIWQGEYANRLPLIRTLLAFNAYSEGWALYAEQLAQEMGANDADPLGEAGYLQSLLFRAARLVTDTGIHWKRWSREEATRYMVDTFGNTTSRAQREVERYFAGPGQANSYKVGHTVWAKVREDAKTRLGPKFDLKAYHDAVLLSGAMPLTVLERHVSEWVARQA